MDLRVIALDFWGTLYRHTKTSSERKLVREELLLRKCRELGLADPEQVSKTFYFAVDRFIKRRWAKGVPSSKEEIFGNVSSYYGGKYPIVALEELMKEVHRTYSGPLKPDIYPEAKMFLRWASRRWPVYLICDTFTVNGKVLDSVMRSDGVLGCFRGRLYSDALGTRKPNRLAVDMISRDENVRPDQIIHIGDLLYTDFYMARRTGSSFILIRHESKSRRPHGWSRSPLFIGEAGSFGAARKMIEELPRQCR